MDATTCKQVEDILATAQAQTISIVSASAVAKAVSREDLAAIRAALNELPNACRYHQDRLDPDRPGWGREACCDTGLPALRRRNAMAALDRIEVARG